MTCEANRIGEDDLQLIDFSEEDDYLIDFPFRDSLEDLRLSVTFDNVNECDRIKLFGGANSQTVERIDQIQSESVEPKRPSFLRKSLAWDSAFFTSAGVLNPEELLMINKGFKKPESSHISPGTQNELRPRRAADRAQTSLDREGFCLETLEGDIFGDVKPNIHKLSKRSKVGPPFGQANEPKKNNIFSRNKVKSVRAPKSPSLDLQGSKGMTKTSIGPQVILDKMPGRTKLISSAKMETKTRKAGSAPDLTVSKRTRWGDVSKSCFASPTTEKDSKVYRKYESSSSASGKSIKRKTDPRNTKPNTSPSSVHFSFTSTCSSSTSPASSIDGRFLESLSDLQARPHALCRQVEERKLASQYGTKASLGTIPFSGGPKRKIKSSGLRMPSPKIGFFDEDQPIRPSFRGSMQVQFGGLSPSNLSPVDPLSCLKVGKEFNGEHDGKKFGSSSRKLKPNEWMPEEISKNKMNTERNRRKDGIDSFEGEATVDDQKENDCGLDQVNGLTRYFEAIDLDRDVVSEVQGQLARPLTCSRTPLAEKTIG